MIVHINALAEQIMTDDAIRSFPDECCGFFFGTDDPDGKKILGALVVNNAKEGDKTRRFTITPMDYMKAEQFADERKWQLLGVYHSHPNHPAIPSEHDRAAAQPFFSYIIISVMQGKLADIRSWVLNDQQQFEEETILAFHQINTI